MQILDKLKQQYLIKKIKKICFYPTYFASCEIYRLLNYETLQNMLFSIKNGKVELSSKLLFGRKVISAEEQFVYILNKYIVFIRDNFHIRTNEFVAIIEETIKSQYSQILYSHLDFNTGENYKIFHREFKKMFLDRLLQNYKAIFRQNIDNKLLTKLAKLSLNNDEELEEIFQIFKDIFHGRKSDLYYFFANYNEQNNDIYIKNIYKIKWHSLLEAYLNDEQYTAV